MTEEDKKGIVSNNAAGYEGGDKIFEALTGSPPTNDEIDDLIFYSGLQTMLRNKRKECNLSQTELAEQIGELQSEISRLERTIGPGTGLGKIRNHLKGCGATLEEVLAEVSNERSATLLERIRQTEAEAAASELRLAELERRLADAKAKIKKRDETIEKLRRSASQMEPWLKRISARIGLYRPAHAVGMPFAGYPPQTVARDIRGAALACGVAVPEYAPSGVVGHAGAGEIFLRTWLPECVGVLQGYVDVKRNPVLLADLLAAEVRVLEGVFSATKGASDAYQGVVSEPSPDVEDEKQGYQKLIEEYKEYFYSTLTDAVER